ncbi:MAG TPA: hypothetical protein ENN46_01190 [Candidatus Woesearchaeota archaeon]|nr:hypothetical protein [Candidatus Woesearchaeota archaeon]
MLTQTLLKAAKNLPAEYTFVSRLKECGLTGAQLKQAVEVLEALDYIDVKRDGFYIFIRKKQRSADTNDRAKE